MANNALMTAPVSYVIRVNNGLPGGGGTVADVRPTVGQLWPR